MTDITTGESWVRYGGARFITASSIKVILMLATLDRAERMRAPLSTYQRSLMVAMIERSDNSAASYFYRLIGGGRGVAAYLIRIGVTGWQVYAPVQSWWGYSTLTPNTMVTVLSRLWHGQMLNRTDRSYALYLMRHVVSGERFGVGDTSPAGSTVEMKDGWVVGPDGYWAVNSSGIVTVNGRTWLISVYTRRDASYAQGVYIARHVAGIVAAILKTR